MIRTMSLVSALAITTACASVPPEPVLEEAAFIEAALVEETPERAVEIVETPTVLPLPGQMKPVEGTKRTVKRVYTSPTETIRKGTTEARIEPSVDGYLNAIQVYPYTEGALYRARRWCPSRRAIPSAGLSGIRHRAQAQPRAPMCWSNRSARAFRQIS